MARVQPVTAQKAKHPFRRLLPAPKVYPEKLPRSAQEDIAFFLVSFASAFIILYGFIL